ncbi:MAG: hypothetical protein CM15mP32_4930 [Flavobacteriaceae bacterium]|nr:MAG: hypothetical protein CM15mP32_4930 [Flavobacteriaceae bacterium]
MWIHFLCYDFWGGFQVIDNADTISLGKSTNYISRGENARGIWFL